jgi:hypothetical protein
MIKTRPALPRRPGVRLDAKQVQTLLSIIHARGTYTSQMTACFDPRHAFIFFDSVGVPVAAYTVCFECKNFYAEPSLRGYAKQTEHGFSSGGFVKLAKLCRELGLKYCPSEADAVQ